MLRIRSSTTLDQKEGQMREMACFTISKHGSSELGWPKKLLIRRRLHKKVNEKPIAAQREAPFGGWSLTSTPRDSVAILAQAVWRAWPKLPITRPCGRGGLQWAWCALERVVATQFVLVPQ